jgi:RNA-directed DNA polymerase
MMNSSTYALARGRRQPETHKPGIIPKRQWEMKTSESIKNIRPMSWRPPRVLDKRCQEGERRRASKPSWLCEEHPGEAEAIAEPGENERVDLSWSKQGFDFLGCHLRQRLSGPILMKTGKRLYFLQCWPSGKAMKRVRERIRELTDSRWNWVRDVRVLIGRLNPVLRGWSNYFRTGNAAIKFVQVDSFTRACLVRFMIRRKGRHLRAKDTDVWTDDFFRGLGLYRLRGTVQYPGAA